MKYSWLTPFAACLILCSTLLVADNHDVNFDSHVDFAKFRTFTIRDSTVTSERAEVNNSIVVTKIHDIVRTELSAKGLKETSARPDLVVNFTVAEQGYRIGPGGNTRPIEEGRGRGGRGQRGEIADIPADFTEGTLVLDIQTVEPKALVWRGVYRDSERNSTKLAKKLPGDAKKLLSEYPPRLQKK